MADLHHEQTLAVVRFADGWRLLPGGPLRKTFASLAAALEEGETLVELAALSGLQVSLLVQEPFGELLRFPPSRPAGTGRGKTVANRPSAAGSGGTGPRRSGRA